ncbi:MAG: transcription elongation factor GreA [Chthonomonas sp.]|nr:transcription elongation factor GreA [Chthonomonas sp.]
MADEILLTQEGYNKLEEELIHLKGPKRLAIADAIREAKAHGDLRENAAYHEAKLNQTRNDSRVADLEKVLQIARVVQRPENAGAMAHLGSKVKLHDKKWDEELVISLVGSFEADPTADLISITSPLGGAILGRSVGDEVEVEAPSGTQQYKILEISE